MLKTCACINLMSTPSSPIWLDAPNVGALEKEYLARAIDSGFVSTVGPFVPEFEQRMARWLGATAAVSTQSGTAALHVSLLESGVGDDDEVVLPALTFVATANPIRYVRARPVFVDVDLDSWTMDVDLCAQALTERTKVLLPVHLLGNPANMDALQTLARQHSLTIIEDATESLGATWNGAPMATFGDFGCLSFNGNKTMTTGGGGMVIGADPERLQHVKFLVNQARDESLGYYHPEVGLNYRMTNLEAALGLAQLARLDDFVARKQRFHEIYAEQLRGIRGIRLQREIGPGRSSWWLNAVFFEHEDINVSELQKALLARGVQCRRLFMPIVEFPPYQDFAKQPCTNSQRIYEHTICLPSSTLNAEHDVEHVCATLKELIG